VFLAAAVRSTRQLLPTLCAAALASSCCVSAFAKDQVPDWVRAAASQPKGTYPAKTDAVTLLDDTTYTVGLDGSVVVHHREVTRILRQQGRKYGNPYVWYRGGEKLRFVHLWSIGPDGTEYAVKDNELIERGAGSFELYSDYRGKGGQPPAVDVGAIVAVEYEKQEHRFENDLTWTPGGSIPVVRERMQLNLPPGATYKASWKGKPVTQAVDLEQGRTLWETTNEPALELADTPMAPAPEALSPRLDVFYTSPLPQAMHGEWKDIGEWYEALSSGRNKPDAAITAKAQELVQGKTGFRERTEAIANFVQGDIRYVAIEIGVGGYQPHAAPDTFKARYGDCKDKATLLSAMLNAVGIRSTWVLVDTERGIISSEAPSVRANHMIAAIELPADYTPVGMYSIVTAKSGKRFLIFDPTWEKTPFGHLERELQGSDALLIDGADSQAIHLPILKPEQNTVARTAKFQLEADGSLSGTVLEARNGDIARDRRYLFLQESEKAQQQTLDRSLANDLQAFTVRDLKAEHAGELSQPITVSYSLKADRFAQEMGPLLAVRPRVLGKVDFPVDLKPRTVPYNLGSTRQIKDDYTIALPVGYEVDELPRPVNVDLGFAAYQSESKVEDHAIHYSRTYTVREVTLPADRSADLVKLSRAIAADEQGSAVLKHSR
jgi:transglutaminase-like putative cysteine protease